MDKIPGTDYPDQIKRLRAKLGMTQAALAQELGVSFPTVNRWENARVTPSQLSWNQLRQLAGEAVAEGEAEYETTVAVAPPPVDFTARPEVVRALVEGERLSFGHMANPVFGTEIARIDPLPHQRIAVYDHMLRQTPLRFLLADDAGAGKTIMSGLYIREMLSRRLLRRIMIVPPAGLVGNWHRELALLFGLQFEIVSGSDAVNGNPFIGPDSDRVIVSVDTLAGPKVFSRLQDSDVPPYDLVIFDEAHKLSADRSPDFRVRKTDRYCLAEAVAGVRGQQPRWELGWSAHHLLLLTATPHMGKDYPYYALWRLLEPEMFATMDAFEQFPQEQRRKHFIRRTKEEMIKLDGTPLYPKRGSDTLGYDLTQGEVSEQRLYDETTEYLRFVYNRAKLLNREAARLAMGVFQRRLASSTHALLRSFERRILKLDALIQDVQAGNITMEQMLTLQRRISEGDDVLESKAADEESPVGEHEENETAEDTLLQGVVAASLGDLVAEREQVEHLRDLAKKVHDTGTESKFEKLREIITAPKFAGEKMIVFTEHRDTLEFLVRRLSGLGFTEQIAQIHGGMHYTVREEHVERFAKPTAQGGARFMICTDAAAEGINLQQSCWIMLNYDVPWNPARLEQRMGRIHRYGQKHDPVIILNLVAPTTREGRVLKVLLDKIEKIRKQLHSDKVFDSIGRVFSGVSIKQYMELAIMEGPDKAAEALDGRLTKEQVKALAEQERKLYGKDGDVVRELPRLRTEIEREAYFKLIPGYVRHFLETAAPQVGIEIDGDLGGGFALHPAKRGAVDPLLSTLELYPERQRGRLSVVRPSDPLETIWIHPGEPVFERFRGLVRQELGPEALKGAVFVDPTADKPYIFHLAQLTVVRLADPELADLAQEDIVQCRLVGVRQSEGAEISLCPVEHLLFLKGGHGLPPAAQRLAVVAEKQKEQAQAFLIERVARTMAMERRNEMLQALPQRESYIQRGFHFQEAELAAARGKLSEKAREGNKAAIAELNHVKTQQRELASRREAALAVLRREPELIVPGEVSFVAHALVVPSSDPADREQQDAQVEEIAMQLARAFEEAAGATVKDVHTPALARTAGLPENPGFDLLSTRPGNGRRCIEVKGRAETGAVEVTMNEWARACNMRDQYWLYAVFDCATANPRLLRVPDPFGRLLAKAKGSVLIEAAQIAEAGEV